MHTASFHRFTEKQGFLLFPFAEVVPFSGRIETSDETNTQDIFHNSGSGSFLGFFSQTLWQF